MPTTRSGDPRYLKRRAARLPAMWVDGIDLGPPLKPQDVLVALRQLLDVSDAEIAGALRHARDRDLAESWPELDEAELVAMHEAAAAVTTSRVVAWRRRNREMTWLELRALLVGLGGGAGDRIDPALVPAARLAAARTALEAALARPGGVPLWARAGRRLGASADGRQLLATVTTDAGDPLVTLAVAPRDRDGAKLWRTLVAAAAAQGVPVPPARPREPWAVALAYGGLARHEDMDGVGWLPALEVELACAWLAIVAERRAAAA